MVLLFVFLLVAYPLVVALGAKQNPITFIKKIANVAVFGFSTSSSAATLPLNIRVCTEDFGVDESIASSYYKRVVFIDRSPAVCYTVWDAVDW